MAVSKASAAATPSLFTDAALPTNRQPVPNNLVMAVGDYDPVSHVSAISDVELVSTAETNAPEQLALSVFQEMVESGQDFPVTESPKDFGYRKAVVLFDTKDLSLVGRRLLNAIFFLISEDPHSTKYEIDLDYLLWLIRYNSRNMVVVKKAIQECQQTLLEIERFLPDGTSDGWASIQALGATKIVRSRVLVELPREIRHALFNPRTYSWLSIRITTMLTSVYAHTLYERLVREAYRGRTNWIDVDTFRGWFRDRNNQPVTRPWKYIKRDIIDVGLRQINEWTDIEVGFHTKCAGAGREVTHVMFTIVQKCTLEPSSERTARLYHCLTKEFGLDRESMSMVISHKDTWTDEYIENAIAFVMHRMETAKPDKPVKYPGKLLMAALQNNYTIPTLEAQAMEKQRVAANIERKKEEAADKSTAKITEMITSGSKTGLAKFELMDAAQQAELIERFKRSTVFSLRRKEIQEIGVEITPEVIFEHKNLSTIFGTFMALGGAKGVA